MLVTTLEGKLVSGGMSLVVVVVSGRVVDVVIGGVAGVSVVVDVGAVDVVVAGIGAGVGP